jgi:CRISPR/Cas system-associated exonuclease Cas4 (RecB family)
MIEIKNKIKDLLLLSKIQVNGFTDISNKMKMQDKIINEIKDMSKSNNTLLGRVLKFQVADSYAYYIITKVNKKSVKVEWIDYYAGWADHRIGYRGLLDLSYTKQTIESEDKLSKIFGN